MLEPIIKEDFLYYIWKLKSFDMTDLKTQDGRTIEIIDFGIQNYDSGPDFTNAKIKIDDTVWVGNVEMHVYSKDWIRHTHDLDKTYDNVVLHVVFEHDHEIFTTTERHIPCLELKERIPSALLGKYGRLISQSKWIACERHILDVPKPTISFWLQRLLIERLERKTQAIKRTLVETQYDWEETLYITLSRYLGARVNMVPFEQLAKALPRKVWLRNTDNPLTMEALFFGQSGMLSGTFEDSYYQKLKHEYQHVKQKYRLKAISAISWKFSRMRPAGFPTIRIAQLVQILMRTNHLFSKIKEVDEIKEITNTFKVQPSEYWLTHYRFGKQSKKRTKGLGGSMINGILLNVVSPLLFLYGKEVDDEIYCNRAIHHLENLKSESNVITRNFRALNVDSKNAAESQALIQLKNEYCDHKKCVACSIGNKIISG